MWPHNTLTERLSLKWPILQAPMGEHTTPLLAAEVCKSGGLGSLGMWGFSAEDAARRIAGVRQQTAGSLNVNYPLWDEPGDLTGTTEDMRATLQPFYDRKSLGPVPQPSASGCGVTAEHLDMLLSTRPEVVSFHFGLPAPDVISALKAAGIFLICSATTVEEARTLEAQGMDAVIAQGTEAGGHHGRFKGDSNTSRPSLLSLLPQVVDAVDIPVIAAGGLADGRGIAAAFMLGASAVQIGTAFLRCPEADVSDGYRIALGKASDTSTGFTDLISGRPARAIHNQLTKTLAQSGARPAPFPAQYGLTGPLGQDDDPEWIGVLAGQSVALTRVMPAADLVETLAAETSARLSAMG